MFQRNEFTLRSYTSTDNDAVVDVVNAAANQTIGVRQAIVDSVGNVRLIRYVPIASQKVVVVNQQNDIVGYAYLADKEQHIVYEVGGAVHPNYWRQGIGTMLLNWAEQHALLLSSSAPIGVKTVLQTNLYTTEREAIALYTRRGYKKLREWLHLVVELDAVPILPPLTGKNMVLREMNLDEDWDIVAPAMDAAFADHWGTISLSTEETLETEEQEEIVYSPEDETYSNMPGFCFILLDKNMVAGGILCNSKLVERNDSGRIGSVFVRPEYRRQGVGRTLMLKAFHTFWQHGIRRIITDTDANSFTQAPTFYIGLGMGEYRSEFMYEKEIRQGKEVRRLSV